MIGHQDVAQLESRHEVQGAYALIFDGAEILDPPRVREKGEHEAIVVDPRSSRPVWSKKGNNQQPTGSV